VLETGLATETAPQEIVVSKPTAGSIATADRQSPEECPVKAMILP
jgi:hypothetical protein